MKEKLIGAKDYQSFLYEIKNRIASAQISNSLLEEFNK